MYIVIHSNTMNMKTWVENTHTCMILVVTYIVAITLAPDTFHSCPNLLQPLPSCQAFSSSILPNSPKNKSVKKQLPQAEYINRRKSPALWREDTTLIPNINGTITSTTKGNIKDI